MACTIYRIISHIVSEVSTLLFIKQVLGYCVWPYHLHEKLQEVLDSLGVSSWRTNMVCPQEFNALYHFGVTNSTDKVQMSCIKTQLHTCPLFTESAFLLDAPTNYIMDRSSLLSSVSFFNKKQSFPLTNFMPSFICCWLFVLVLLLLVLLLPFHNCMNIQRTN
jgi:hypothetical protein